MSKKITSLLVAIAMSICAALTGLSLPVSAAANGTFGDSLTWNLDDSGTLTIDGTGEMPDYTLSSTPPWYASRTLVKSVVIGNEVTSIGSWAFSYCQYLTSITIGNGVQTIGENAFNQCKSLTSITIPASTTTLQSGVFNSCMALETIVIEGHISFIGSNVFTGTAINDLSLTSIFSAIDIIPTGTFQSCTGITNVTIPSNITSIGSYAFTNSSITSITIPDTCTLDNAAYSFKGCSKLITAALPTTTTSIPKSLFSDCKLLRSVSNFNRAETIGENAFFNCYVLEFSGPMSATAVGDYSFTSCRKLNDFTIFSNLKTIGSAAFMDTGLTEVTLSAQITSIGQSAFASSQELTTFTLANSSTIIPIGLLNGCKKLTTVNLPSTLKQISNNTFQNCTALESITIPDSVYLIGQNAFRGCTSLKSINLPSGLSTLGQYALADCTSFKNVTIPAGLTVISSNVFNGCSSLKTISILGTTRKTITATAFNNTPALQSIKFIADSTAYPTTVWGQANTVSLVWNYDPNVNPIDGAMNVSLNISANYYVCIPQTINVDEVADISYEVKVYGSVSGEDQVTVTPPTTITFAKAGSTNTITDITITQAKTSWLGTAIFEATDTTNIDANKASGTVGVSAKADEFTAGEWTSTVAFAIAFINN